MVSRRFSRTLVVAAALAVWTSLFVSAQDGGRTVGKRPNAETAAAGRLYSKLHAVCIGINDYAAAAVPDLSYAEADARDMAQLLKNLYGFDDVRLLLGAEATKDNILAAIADLFDADRVSAGDAVVIYFSGHGQTVTSGTAEIGFLIPQNAKIDFNNVKNPAPYVRDALRMDDLKTSAEQIPAQHVLFLVDACYSGFLTHRSPVEASLSNALKYPARQVLTAGTRGEQAVEHNAWGHGAFTFKLLEILRAETRPLSASRLGVLLKERVPREVAAKFGDKRQLSPQAKYLSGDGDFLFIRPGAKLDAEPDRPAVARPETPAETIARLLQAARDNDDKPNGRRALAALNQLLAIEPDHAEALKLRRKIRAYYGAATLNVPTQDYPTIQKALDDANPGDTVRVEAGIYEEALTFREGVRLIGAGADKVTVRCGAKQANVIWVSGITAGLIAGLTAEHVGTSDDEKGRFAALLIRDSNVEILRCTFQNAAGHGIAIDGRSQPTIRECVAQQNPWNGIYVNGKEAAPVLRNNQCHGNQQNGIYLGQGAGGTAEGNTCENNKYGGITIYDASTAPALRNNQCRENQRNGIYFGAGAGGTAEGNTCENNKYSGITIYDASTAPALRNNQCRGNQSNGIYFGNGAGGTAEGNICENNKESGITVRDANTASVLRNNQCRGNQMQGIYFGASAGGTAENNTCENNKGCGILVYDANTAPALRNNQCRGNQMHGIQFRNDASGTAEGNVCENNEWSGIAASDAGTAPKLRGNRCDNNKNWGIAFWNDARPEIASDNKASGNAQGQIQAAPAAPREAPPRKISALLLEITDATDPIEVGASEAYEITLTNQGSGPAANLVITCLLPPEMEFVSWSGPTSGTTQGKTLKFAPLPALASKEKMTYKVTAKSVKAGDVRFKAILTGAPITTPVEETESTHIYK